MADKNRAGIHDLIAKAYLTEIIPLLNNTIAEIVRPYYSEEEPDKPRNNADKYLAALLDWVDKGPASRYALAPEEVLRRSRPRPLDDALGAAHFELGQYLYRQGQLDLATAHFRKAHHLQPDNWTYRRQAWSMADPFQRATDLYESDLATEIRKGNFSHPPFEMD